MNLKTTSSPKLNQGNNLLANSVPKSPIPCNNEPNFPYVTQPKCSVPVNLPSPCEDIPPIQQSNLIIQNQRPCQQNLNLLPQCQIPPTIVPSPSLIENSQGFCPSPTPLGQINLPIPCPRPQCSYPLQSKQESVSFVSCQPSPPCFNNPLVSDQSVTSNVPSSNLFSPLICEESLRPLCGPSIEVPQPSFSNCGCNSCSYPTFGQQICQNLPIPSLPCLSNNKLTIGPQIPCFSPCPSAQPELLTVDSCSEPIIPFYPFKLPGIDDVFVPETSSIETTVIITNNPLTIDENTNCGCDYCAIINNQAVNPTAYVPNSQTCSQIRPVFNNPCNNALPIRQEPVSFCGTITEVPEICNCYSNCPRGPINCPSLPRPQLPLPCQPKPLSNSQVATPNGLSNQPLQSCSPNPSSNLIPQVPLFGSSSSLQTSSSIICGNTYSCVPESFSTSPCLAPIVPMVSIPEVNLENDYFYPFMPVAYPGSCYNTNAPVLPPVQITSYSCGECYRLTKPIPPPFI